MLLLSQIRTALGAHPEWTHDATRQGPSPLPYITQNSGFQASVGAWNLCAGTNEDVIVVEDYTALLSIDVSSNAMKLANTRALQPLVYISNA